MGLEAATYISGLVATNSVGAIDPRSQGDDHLRLIKSVLLATLPALTGAVTATHTELSQLHGGALTSIGTGAVGAPSYSFSGDTDTGIWHSSANTIDFATAGVNRLSISTTSISIGLQFLSPAGALASPAYSFTADNDTGIYNSGSGTLDFVSNGTLVAEFFGSSSPQVGFPTGSAAAPGIVFFSDPNTGLYRPSADRLAFVANGSDCASVDVGRFGFAVPLWASNGSAGSPSYSFLSDTDTGMYWPAVANNLALVCGGTITAYLTTTNAQFLDGTINNPGITFSSETSSGLARTAASTVVLSAGGAQCITSDNVSNSGLGQVRIHKQLYLDVNSSSTATAGAGSALPATPQGYIAVTINGTQRRIPYYAN